jgi:hypothetical protein
MRQATYHERIWALAVDAFVARTSHILASRRDDGPCGRVLNSDGVLIYVSTRLQEQK